MIVKCEGETFQFDCEFDEERHAMVAVVNALHDWGKVRSEAIARLQELGSTAKQSKAQPTQDRPGEPSIHPQGTETSAQHQGRGRTIPDDVAHLHQEIFARLETVLSNAAEAWLSVSDI